MRAIAMTIALCAGCSKLLGIEDLHPRDAGPDLVDVNPDVPVVGCDAGLASVAVLEDTMLLDEGGNMNPSIRHGADPTIDLGLNGTSRLLLRFDLSSAAAATTALAGASGTIAATLTITTAATPQGAATTFQLFAATDGWNEGTGNYVGASWYQRIGISSGNQMPWQIAGADGTSDRGQTVLATRAVTTAEAAAANNQIHTTFMLDGNARADIAARMVSNRMSLLLVPTAGGTLFVTSRETSASATQLAFSVCP
jgi:hypothetical protein